MALATPESWGIQGVAMDLGEISAAAAVAKHSGSIFSRKENTTLLDAFEAVSGIRIQGIPTWLMGIELTRSAIIRGAHMRQMRIPKIMEELDIHRLSGLATLVVLCCRYSEDEATMTKMIDLLMVGELGTVVRVDRDRHIKTPYTCKGHIRAFIASCLDADRESDVSKRATEWMAQLHNFGDLTAWTPKEFFLRRQEASIDIIGQILGAAGIKGNEDQQQDDDATVIWAKVHNTLHLTCAYIALAAAAHGASVVVECVSDSGSKMFPGEPDPNERKSTFLVRLWLTQPPEHIYGILRKSEPENTDTPADSDLDVIVVGGPPDIAIWVARKLEFRCQARTTSPDNNPTPLLELWRRGIEYGRTMQWTVRRALTTKTFGTLLLVLEPAPNSGKDLLAPEAAPLSRALLTADNRVRPLARVVANIVHQVYQLSDYSHLLSRPDSDDDNTGESTASEMVKAMRFVVVCVAVGALHATINPVGDSTETYALNLATLNGGRRATGNLHDLVRSALNEGVAPYQLLTTAATLWGGAQFSSTGRPGAALPVEYMLGVIAPRCTVIFDMLRDPLAFAREDRTDRLLSIWRGSVPILPRDPRTNCIYGGVDDRWRQFDVWPDYVPKNNNMQTTTTLSGGLGEEEVKGPMVVTFEPFDREASCGVFCCWHGGSLVAEFAPHAIFTATLSGSARAATQTSISSSKSGDISVSRRTTTGATTRASKYVEIGKADLLEIAPGGFAAKGKCAVVVKGLGGDAGWTVFALGCAAGPSASTHHLLTFIYRGDVREFDIGEFGKDVNDGQVVVVVG